MTNYRSWRALLYGALAVIVILLIFGFADLLVGQAR